MKDAIIDAIVKYLHELGFTQFQFIDIVQSMKIMEHQQFGKVQAIKHLQAISRNGNHLRRTLKGLEDTSVAQYILTELQEYDTRLSLKEAKQIMDVLQRLL